MSAIGDILAAIETRLTTLGFTATKAGFNFDAVPSSTIHKSFFIDDRQIKNEYNLGGEANPVDAIEVFIAYKTYRDEQAARNAALADREAIEKDLINAAGISGLSCNPLLEMDGEATAQKHLGDYLVSRLVFTADYIRDI